MDGYSCQTAICHPEDLSDTVRSRLFDSQDRICREAGRVYIRLGQIAVCCPDDEAGNAMIHELMLNTGKAALKPETASGVYQMILEDPGYIPDQALLKKCRIRVPALRTVIVFRCISALKKDLFSLLSEMVPLESGDVIIPSDYGTVIMIKETDKKSGGELTEYVEAAVCTMEGEGISEVMAGIGQETDRLKNLRQSFQEGNEALRLGMKYHRRDHIHRYADLTLERIVDCVPEREMAEIRSAYLKGGNLSAYNDEMIETVRCFMKNDLNLTAASRQLFIHRNTLNYRLDKIKKETGLDLRSFQDAAVFRLVSLIPEKDTD